MNRIGMGTGGVANDLDCLFNAISIINHQSSEVSNPRNCAYHNRVITSTTNTLIFLSLVQILT